jgi:hypothetical protein
MERRMHGYEVRHEFFELVCLGMSLERAARVLGVAPSAGKSWWRASSGMKPEAGSSGGLSGSAPLRVVGDADRQGRQRRSLSSEDRAVIAAGIRADWSYARIGEAIGRDKSVVWREVDRNKGPDGSYWAPVAHRVAHNVGGGPRGFGWLRIRVCVGRSRTG